MVNARGGFGAADRHTAKGMSKTVGTEAHAIGGMPADMQVKAIAASRLTMTNPPKAA